MARNKNVEMTITELFNVLGARIKVTLDDKLSPEERQTENEQSIIVMNVGKQMLNAADIAMRHETLQAKCRNLEKSVVKDMLGDFDDAKA